MTRPAVSRRRLLLSAVPASLACQRRKAEGFPGYAFVANSEGRAVAVVDLGAFAATRHILLDANPTQVVTHPLRPYVLALTPETASVHEIETTTLATKRSVRCGAQADSMRLTPDGGTLWVLQSQRGRLIAMNADSLEVIARHAVPAGVVDWELSLDGRLTVLGYGWQGTVMQLDLRTGERWLADCDGTADVVRFRSDGRQVLVGNRGRRSLSMLDAEAGRLVVHLPLAVEPRHFCAKPDGGQLFITGDGMDVVVTVHPFQTQIASTTLAGPAPGPMGASSNPSYLFVTNPGAGDVTILEIESQRVIAVVAVGSYPYHVTVTPDSQYALVLNRDSGDMAVIRLETLSGRRGRMAPLFTMVPVGSRPVSTVVRAVGLMES